MNIDNQIIDEQVNLSKKDVIERILKQFYCSYELDDNTLTIDGTNIHIKVFEEVF